MRIFIRFFCIGVLCALASFVIYHHAIEIFHIPPAIVLTVLNPTMVVSAYFAFGSHIRYVFGSALSCVLTGLLFGMTAYGFSSNSTFPRILAWLLLLGYIAVLGCAISLG